MGTMTAPMGPSYMNVSLDALVNRDLDKDGRDLLENLQKASAATSTTTSGDMLMEPASKKQKLHEPPVDSAVDALLRAGRKKPPWTPTEQAVVAIKHCELGNRWTQIAAYLPLRSENDVKNIWHSTLRCKDTQKRSFLRTYALAVHDHAYDYPTRKAMFDIAVRQCGPPPQQAAEMIARVQLLMDHPELQAAVQQPQQSPAQHLQSLDSAAQQPHEQLAQLQHLLSSKREDMQQQQQHHHQQLAHLAQLQQLQHQQQQQLMLMPYQQDGTAADVDDVQDDASIAAGGALLGLKCSASAAKLGKDADQRRPRTSRDKYCGDVGGEPDGMADNGELGTGQESRHGGPLERSGSLQQKLQLPIAGLRGYSLDQTEGGPSGSLQRSHTDSGVSAIRRYNAATGSGDGGSAGGSGSGGSYATAPADSLPVTLAHIAAAAAADSPANGALSTAAGPTAAAGGAGAEALSVPPRQPGVPLPALGNLLALLYKYNIEQTAGGGPGPGQGKQGSGDWPTGGEKDEGPQASTAAAAAAGGLESIASAAVAAAAAAAGAGGGADGHEDRGSKLAGGASNPAGPLGLLPLALRPLQSQRESEGKGEGDDAVATAAAAGSPTGADDDSPKLPASSASARSAGNKRTHGSMSGAAAATPSTAGGGAGQQQPPALRQRNSMPYSMQDADADELGAVEALALAARLNTQGGRTGPGAAVPAPPAGAAASGGVATANGGVGGRRNSGGTGTPASGSAGLVSPRNGSGCVPTPGSAPTPAAATPASAPTPPMGSSRASMNANGGPAAGLGPSGPSGPVLDLHPRPASSQGIPAPPQLPSRSSLSFRPPSTASGEQLHGPHGSLPGPRQLQPSLQQQQQPSAQQQNRVGPYLDVVSVLNMPNLRRQVLALPAQTLVALLGSPLFGSDSEASVFVLVALWLQANCDSVTLEQIRKLCGAMRLSALGGFYLSAVLPLVVTDPRATGKTTPSPTTPGAVNVRPGSRWFEIRSEEVAFLTRYVNAGGVERALLADVAQGVYDCTSPWYDMTPRSMGMPSEGFCFEWHIPKHGLRDALANGAQPHATFSVREETPEGDDASAATAAADGATGIAIVPYIICRGLEWHVFVDCQQRPGGAVAAGVFVYCRVPGVLRPPAGGGSSGVVGVVPGAGIRLGVHGWRCGRLEEVFVWTFGDETYFVPDAGMGCPSALPLRKRPNSPPGGSAVGRGGGGNNPVVDDGTAPWADYLHDGGLRGTLTFLPP